MAITNALDVRQKLAAKGFDSRQVAVISEMLQDLLTSVANLNAWATALATKLNADAGVTDTNYDTNPQA
jgi:hypothetical protein